MREKDSVFSSACHNSFAALPLNWSLRGMLMLRESGIQTARPSLPSLRVLVGPPTDATEHAQKEHLLVRQIRGDSQSDRFK